MKEDERKLLKGIQGTIQSGEYFLKYSNSSALAFSVIQIDSIYKELISRFPDYQHSSSIPESLIGNIKRSRNKLAHETILGDTAESVWETLKTDLYQLDTKLKKILGDDYTIISEIPAKEFEEVDSQIHADVVIQNDRSVAIMHSIADTPRIQQIHDDFLLKEKQFQTENKKQITERFTNNLQIIIDEYNNIQNQINRRKSKLSQLEQEIQKIGEQKHSPEALTVKIEELQKQKQMLEKTLKSYITIKDSLPKSKLSFFNVQKQIAEVISLTEKKISETETQIAELAKKIDITKSLKEKKVAETDMKSKIQGLEAEQSKLAERFQKGFSVAKQHNITIDNLKNVPDKLKLKNKSADEWVDILNLVTEQKISRKTR